jgi:CDP-diacylglycerol--serine O-phosphatidyltransferase
MTDNSTTPGAASARRQARFRPVPLRLLIPNLLTLLALCLGLTAIRFAYEGSIQWAVSAIAAAAVLDGLDGRVAPGIVLYLAALDRLHGLGWLVVLLFSIACALRLARFNVMIDDPEQPAWRKNFFVGMPAPAGAVVGLLPVYLKFLGGAEPTASGALLGLEAIYVFAIALLMASRVPHFSGKSIGRVPREYVAVVLIALAGALLTVVYYPLQALVALSLAYLASIPFAVRHFRKLQSENV